MAYDLYVVFLFFVCSGVRQDLTIWGSWWVSYNKQEQLIVRGKRPRYLL